MPEIGIVGAGTAGLHLALLLQQRGLQPTLYAERSADEVRDGRLPNTVAHHHHTRSREQLRQIEAIVDGQARRREVARELERLFASDVVPVAAVRRAVAVPVVDAELPLSRARVVVMGDGAR